MRDDDSEESDDSDYAQPGGLVPHAGAVPTSEEEDEEAEEGVDYYWDTAPGLAMARNFNLHCLPLILEQIASCGALGLILSAAERSQVIHTKARDRGSRASGRESGKVDTASADAVAAVSDDVGAAYVYKYAIYIVRQLTLNLRTLTESAGGGSCADTHRSSCPVCRGLGPTFVLP